MEEIPLPLIINWDQSGTHYVPVSEWRMDVKGVKRVEIGGLNDKRQMTVALAGTRDGEFLPLQLIYSGTTSKSLPKNTNFPPEWYVTTTPTHWRQQCWSILIKLLTLM